MCELSQNLNLDLELSAACALTPPRTGAVYIPIAWYPLSTYSVVPVTFLAASLNR